MPSLFKSTIFRLKVAQIIFSIISIIPLFGENISSSSTKIFYDFVNLIWFVYLGIGIITLLSICLQEPVAEKVALYSSCLAVILHFLAMVFIFWEAFRTNSYVLYLVISGLFTGANSVAFTWEVLVGFGYTN